MLSLPEDIISYRESILNLEKYITEMEINLLCYKLIGKIPINKRTIKLNNILSKFKDKKNQIVLNSNKEDIKNQYNFMPIITKDDLPKLEKNLDEQIYVEKLIMYLKKQNFLFNYLNIEEISKHFSSQSKELFNLLIENEEKFNEKALNNLLIGFYKNSENEINETFEIFNKIKQYQNKFPFSIEINLKLEEFLNKKLYEQFHSFDLKLNETFNDFSYLNGFAIQHQKFILYILNLSEPQKKQEILNKIISFLVEKNYDIGTDIYKEILENINQNDFINMINNVFSTKKISNKIKEMTKEKLYLILIETDNKITLIKSFKFFIDFIILPNKILDYLISLLKNEINKDLYDEIIFCLGNYFSTNKTRQENYLNNIIKLASRTITYQNILNRVREIKDKKDFFYLYSCVNYTNINISSLNEIEILNVPIRVIASIIKSLNKELNTKLFFKNLQFLNKYYHYNIFNPQRDKIVRKLYFNNKKYPLTKLILICC